MSFNALIIDDNPGNLDVLVELLKLQNVSSVSALSPRDIDRALDLAGDVKVVFLDLEFPNDSGMASLQVLRDHPRLQGATFVACTVHTSERNEAMAAGFDSFIGKPIDVDRFPGHLARILSGEAVWEV
jgi:CheY-like chemotaxis protein